jgi:hypothetical protein
MIAKKILNPERIRRIEGGFGFIPHRLITEGFVAALDPHELLVYFFLILVADRNGLSYYAYDSICSFLSMTVCRGPQRLDRQGPDRFQRDVVPGAFASG